MQTREKTRMVSKNIKGLNFKLKTQGGLRICGRKREGTSEKVDTDLSEGGFLIPDQHLHYKSNMRMMIISIYYSHSSAFLSAPPVPHLTFLAHHTLVI